MWGAARRFEAWFALPGAIGLFAWSMLALDAGGVTPSAFCASGTSWPQLWSSFGVALVLNAPAKFTADWALMVAAMMAPLLLAPLRHGWDRSFARRRARATLLFVAGYAAAWMVAGVVLQATALAALLAMPAAPIGGLGLVAAAAMGWQVSPAKQWCLNRCHRRPQLAAFGAAADVDALSFGLSNGAACVGTCWALMLLMLLVGSGHFAAMLAVTLFVLAERLENPAPLGWRLRGAGKALRIVTAQVRMRLAPPAGIGEVLP
jgi:predicted metal-binding membrane protein